MRRAHVGSDDVRSEPGTDEASGSPRPGTTLSLKETVSAHYPQASDEAVDAALEVLQQAGDPSRQALVARLFHAVGALARMADERVTEAALGRASDFGLLIDVLNAPSVAARARHDDPLMPARLRWPRDRERLLSAQGGAVPADIVIVSTRLPAGGDWRFGHVPPSPTASSSRHATTPSARASPSSTGRRTRCRPERMARSASCRTPSLARSSTATTSAYGRNATGPPPSRRR